MTASPTFTWHGTPSEPARRPSLAELGGDAMEDDVTDPPEYDGTMLYAAQMNERGRAIRGANATCPSAVLYIRFNAGAPLVDDVITVDDALATGDFVLTDNGDGDTTIEWLTYKLPPLSVRPAVSLSEDVEIDRVRAYTVAASAADKTAVRVKTKLGATGTNCAVVVTIY